MSHELKGCSSIRVGIRKIVIPASEKQISGKPFDIIYNTPKCKLAGAQMFSEQEIEQHQLYLNRTNLIYNNSIPLPNIPPPRSFDWASVSASQESFPVRTLNTNPPRPTPTCRRIWLRLLSSFGLYICFQKHLFSLDYHNIGGAYV